MLRHHEQLWEMLAQTLQHDFKLGGQEEEAKGTICGAAVTHGGGGAAEFHHKRPGANGNCRFGQDWNAITHAQGFL